MIDLSKIADIALIMLDASIGFEIGTFEFLSLLKNHGFTSVFGILTKMDRFRQNKSLNKLKKQMKKRFIKEATDKAKLFFLYGVKNELYLKMQMHNLARYLRVIKPSTPGFRINHPYILADRFDVNLTGTSEDPEEDVMVSFFGYVRGNNFSKFSNVHVNGLGDFKIDYMTKVEDPCPIETVEVKGRKKRSLKQKEKVLYAPYCNINTLEYDRNEGYINIPDRFVAFTKRVEDENINVDMENFDENMNNKFKLNEGVRMVRELQEFNKDEKYESKLIFIYINYN
jgi:ribosome biogenesis protein BMS1